MKTVTVSIKTIRCAQIKILSRLLATPLYKLSVYLNTEFDKLFRLENDEKDGFDLAWTMLKDDGLVYTDIHEIGIKSEALPVAKLFIVALKETMQC